jgi:hypothetical protein
LERATGIEPVSVAWETALAANLFNSLADFWHSFSTPISMCIYLRLYQAAFPGDALMMAIWRRGKTAALSRRDIGAHRSSELISNSTSIDACKTAISWASHLRMPDLVGIPTFISILRRLRHSEIRPHTWAAISSLNSDRGSLLGHMLLCAQVRSTRQATCQYSIARRDRQSLRRR